MNDQVTLVGLTDFMRTYNRNANLSNSAPEPGAILLGLIESAKDGIRGGMNTCCLILKPDQCEKKGLFEQGVRFEFSISQTALGLVIDFDGMVENR